MWVERAKHPQEMLMSSAIGLIKTLINRRSGRERGGKAKRVLRVLGSIDWVLNETGGGGGLGCLVHTSCGSGGDVRSTEGQANRCSAGGGPHLRAKVYGREVWGTLARETGKLFNDIQVGETLRTPMPP